MNGKIFVRTLANALASRLRRGVLVFAMGLLASTFSSASPLQKITIATVAVSESPTHLVRFHLLVYAEAFRRLGYEFNFQELPPKRGSLLANYGILDGEIPRSAGYGAAHPNLIRVEESTAIINFSAFSTNPAHRLNGWSGLKGADLRVEYRYGLQAIEAGLAENMPAIPITTVAETRDGLAKLQGGRTDIYIDVEESVQSLLAAGLFHGVQKIGTMESISLHAYLHPRHHALAPKLSDTLRQMKREGLMDVYKLRAHEAVKGKLKAKCKTIHECAPA